MNINALLSEYDIRTNLIASLTRIFFCSVFNSKSCKDYNTDERTDVWSRNFITWKINFGLWAVAWAGLMEKGVWANSEQLFWVVFSIFHGQKIQKKNFFENIVASALKKKYFIGLKMPL